MIIENWKDIIGYEGAYQVSSFGRVKSLGRIIKHPHSKIRTLRERVLKSYNRCGYTAVELNKTSNSTHRLVADAFIPNPENKPCVNHINGIKNDNRVENLEWCTQSENSLHSFRIGTQSNKGENHPNSKITLVQSKEIKDLLSKGELTQIEIAKRYNISNHLVCKIKKRKLWNY